jgi:cysteine desulfurase
MSAREVYADHAATTPMLPEALEAMRPYLDARGFGNASSVHRRGEAARDVIERARGQVAALVGGTPEEIVFTASGSEANNLAIKGIMLAAAPERRRLVVSAIEHPSVLETARHLETRDIPVTIVPVRPDGIVEPGQLGKALGPDVALVSVMAVNNETGVEQPVRALAALAHAAGAKFHCDAVQAAGKRPLDVAASGVDLLSIAGHKFHGPLGAAALFVRRRTRLVPVIHGGHQERSRRAGTENLPAIVGLGVAAERAGQRLRGGEPTALEDLGTRLLETLLARVPHSRLNGDRALRLRTIVNVCFPGVDGEAVLHELDRAGITVSTGSACSAATPGPSHVLTAMGLSAEDAHASVRFSIGEGVTMEDVEYLGTIVPSVVSRLRTMEAWSPPARSGADRATPQRA